MAELIVNTEAVLHNYRHYAENGQVIPVLKSNGYALGAKQLQTLLAQQGAALFACATADEALALAGEETDLLLLSCVHDMTLLRQLLQRRVIVSVESLAQAQAIDALHMDARIHLAVDSGFGRFGFLPEQVEDIKQVFALKGVHVCGIFSHFRCRDAAPEQFARFSQVLLALSDYPVGLRHIAATHTADIPQYRLDAVRIGSGLTGCGCSGLAHAAVMQAQICAVRHLKPDLVAGEREDRREDLRHGIEDDPQRALRRAAGGGIRAVAVQAVLDDIEIEARKRHDAEIVDGVGAGQEFIVLIDRQF